MKTTAKAETTAVNAKTLEDIIFEGRNQNYGAYSLRKNYNNHLNLSFFIILSLAILVVSLAFLRSRMAPPVIEEPDIPIFRSTPTQITFQPELPEQQARKAVAPLAQGPDENATPIVTDDPVEEDQIMIPEDKLDQTGSQVEPTPIPTTIEPPVVNIPDDKTYNETQVTTQALFAGGSVENFRKWLSKNIHYPEDAISNDVNGKVFLQFTIDKTGNICDIKVLKGIHPVIDQAAIRALKSSPKWTAASKDGQPVRVSYFLPIAFQILK
jgi:protein TonB